MKKYVNLILISCYIVAGFVTSKALQRELVCQIRPILINEEKAFCTTYSKPVSIITYEEYKKYDNEEKEFLINSYQKGTTPHKVVTFRSDDGTTTQYLVKQSTPIQVINTIIATFLFKALLGDELIPDNAVVDAHSTYLNECLNNPEFENIKGVRRYYIASKLFDDVIRHLGNDSGNDLGSPCFCYEVYGFGWGIGFHILNIKEHPLYQGTEKAAIISMLLQDTDVFSNCYNHAYRKFGSMYKLVRLDFDHADLFFAPFKTNPICVAYNTLINASELFTEVGKNYIEKLHQEKDEVLAVLYEKIDESFEILRTLYTDEEIRLIYRQCASRFIISLEADNTPHYIYTVGQGPHVNSLDDLKEKMKLNLKIVFENIKKR